MLFQALLSAGLSVIIKGKRSEAIVGACLNFDARSKEAEPLCACAAFSRNNVNKNGENEVKVTNSFYTPDPLIMDSNR